MKHLYSIESIEQHHVIDTGCKPLLVHTNEIADYLVKYVKGDVPAEMLAREFIAAHFCKLWNIPFPECALVSIKQEHLSAELGIGTVKFQRPGLGTKWNKSLKEIDQVFNSLTNHQVSKIINKDAFLNIAFFDIWMSNEDRSSGNYNLMIEAVENGYEFTAIDHGAVFHTGNQDKPNYPITLQDSLLNSQLLYKIYTNKQLYDVKLHEELKKSWYICASLCKKQYNEIIELIPESWNINKSLLASQLSVFMMNDEWFDTCWKTFIEFLQRTKTR